MDSKSILAQEEALDFERTFRDNLDQICKPPQRWRYSFAAAESLAAESPSGYLCTGCQGHATHYAPSGYRMAIDLDAGDRYPLCLDCRELLIMSAYQAYALAGGTEEYDTWSRKYTSEEAIESMTSGPLTKRTLAAFAKKRAFYTLHVLIPRGMECHTPECDRMGINTRCPQHIKEAHLQAVAEHEHATTRAYLNAIAATPALFLAAIGLPLWLIPATSEAVFVSIFTTLTAIALTAGMWGDATNKRRHGRPKAWGYM